MSVITSSGENYDIAFADNYVVNAQKGAYADLTELYKKEDTSSKQEQPTVPSSSTQTTDTKTSTTNGAS